MDDQEIDADVALAAAQPALLHAEFVEAVGEPRDADADGESATGAPSQHEQNDSDRRCKGRVLDEDGHGSGQGARAVGSLKQRMYPSGSST